MYRCAMISLPIAALLVGCVPSNQHVHELDQHGEVFYFDGAGGGSILTDWGRGVKEGLKLAHYPGDFQEIIWNTGLGVAADQGASLDYKRSKAKEAAARIEAYMASHPGRAVNIVALSAGTAVAAFTLEELRDDAPVETAILLGSSLSSHYDMTKALSHVRNRLFVFTSDKDAVLGVAVVAAGTADRQFCGACSAGLRGFHLPGDADDRVRMLYSRIENIDWRPEFIRSGNFGGHTDSVNPAFVRDYVAPLISSAGPRFTRAGDQPTANAANGAISQ